VHYLKPAQLAETAGAVLQLCRLTVNATGRAVPSPFGQEKQAAAVEALLEASWHWQQHMQPSSLLQCASAVHAW
jgi:hypothetical protein